MSGEIRTTIGAFVTNREQYAAWQRGEFKAFDFGDDEIVSLDATQSVGWFGLEGYAGTYRCGAGCANPHRIHYPPQTDVTLVPTAEREVIETTVEQFVRDDALYSAWQRGEYTAYDFGEDELLQLVRHRDIVGEYRGTYRNSSGEVSDMGYLAMNSVRLVKQAKPARRFTVLRPDTNRAMYLLDGQIVALKLALGLVITPVGLDTLTDEDVLELMRLASD